EALRAVLDTCEPAPVPEHPTGATSWPLQEGIRACAGAVTRRRCGSFRRCRWCPLGSPCVRPSGRARTVSTGSRRSPMFLLDDTLVYSASDLTLAQDCEFALLSRLDEKLGRRPRLQVSDPMRERAARLGDEHEARVLAEYRERFGAGVVEIEVPRRYDAPSLREHADP